jgi:hypothetical protein
MKKIGIMLVMIALSFSGRTQSLNNTDWQLQNPPSKYIDEKLYFGNPISEVGEEHSSIVATRMNYSPYSTATSELMTGNWQQSIDNVTINFLNINKDSSKKVTLSYKIIWLTSNKIKLIDEKGNELIYAKQGSPDDHYAENLFK